VFNFDPLRDVGLYFCSFESINRTQYVDTNSSILVAD